MPRYDQRHRPGSLKMGAARDVVEGRPASSLRCPAPDNVLCHAAPGTAQTRKAIGQMMHDTLLAHIAGKVLSPAGASR